MSVRKFRAIAVIAGVCAIVLAALPAAASDIFAYTVIFKHNGGDRAVSIRAWLPDNVPAKGFLYLSPSNGGDTRYYILDDEFRSFAQSVGLGIIGIQDRDGFPGHYEGATAAEIAANVQAVLDCVAKGLGHSEVGNLPVVFTGFSKGAWMSGELAAAFPQRTLCVATDKGGTWGYAVDAEGRFVPGFFIAGNLDTLVNRGGVGLFNLWRPGNGQVAVVQDWNTGHWSTDFDCIKAFIAHSVAKRYPAGLLPSPLPGNPLPLIKIDPNSGWLVEQESDVNVGFTWIASPYAAPATQYTKSIDTACWVTDRTMAGVLRAKNVADPNTGARAVNLSCTGSCLVGQPIDLQLSNKTLDPAAVTRVQVFHEDEVIGDYPALSPGGIALSYTPTQSGVHTFWTEVTTLIGGQPSYAWNYCTTVVLTEAIPALTNHPPVVDAGPDQVIVLPATAALVGQANDDGLPYYNNTTVTWSVVSGPGEVTFSNVNSAVTTATVYTPGTYVLRLSANDTEQTTWDEVTLTATGVFNYAPMVAAYCPSSIVAPVKTVNLSGSVSDDGWPKPAALTCTWSVVSGPGRVVFADTAAPVTTATFLRAGTYVLRLTASDGLQTVFAQTTVTQEGDLRADFNDDGRIDGLDFLAWQAGYPAASGATRKSGDANGDGAVNGLDFLLWQTGFRNWQ